MPQDTARDSAEKTLAALTEQNQRLSGEKAAAEAQARDATVRTRPTAAQRAVRSRLAPCMMQSWRQGSTRTTAGALADCCGNQHF